MLDNGTGNVSNVYSKDEVNNLVDSLDTKITNNTNEITNMKRNIEELQSNLNNYALQSELEQTNINVENLSSLVNSNTESINNLNNRLEKNIGYPDLTKNQKIIIGNGTYTIKENGYIRVYFAGTSGNVKVNGVAYIYSGLNIEMTFPPMLVKAGDIITAVGFKDNNSSVSFVPFC